MCIVDFLKYFILFRRSNVYRSPEVVVPRLSVFSNPRRCRKLGIKNQSWSTRWLRRIESNPCRVSVYADSVLDRLSWFRLFGRALIVERWIIASPESRVSFSVEERGGEEGRDKKRWKIFAMSAAHNVQTVEVPKNNGICIISKRDAWPESRSPPSSVFLLTSERTSAN